MMAASLPAVLSDALLRNWTGKLIARIEARVAAIAATVPASATASASAAPQP
jgi:cytochrome oxidase assembly protein ShyY1